MTRSLTGRSTGSRFRKFSPPQAEAAVAEARSISAHPGIRTEEPVAGFDFNYPIKSPVWRQAGFFTKISIFIRFLGSGIQSSASSFPYYSLRKNLKKREHSTDNRRTRNVKHRGHSLMAMSSAVSWCSFHSDSCGRACERISLPAVQKG